MSDPSPSNVGFVLNPQQQRLLLATIIHSNKPEASALAQNSGLALSPSSFQQSPTQTTEATLGEDGSFLEYDASGFNLDSSYDLSGIDVADMQPLGDMSGVSPSKSDSAESPTQHEKRSRPEDENDQDTTSKRRESTEKVPKKPGRKPLTSEPSTKRKAQNRAAQRAFRERKEKHLRDLETKVEELQKASDSANDENEKLRARIDRMTTEINEYKKRVALLTNNRSFSNTNNGGAGLSWGSTPVSNLNDLNFYFEFPKFGSLPGAPPAASMSNQRSMSAVAKENQMNPRTLNAASPANSLDVFTSSASHSGDEFSNLNGFVASTFTNSHVPTASLFGSIDSTNANAMTATSSPSASSGSNIRPTSSCRTSPEPLAQSPMGFKPSDPLGTIGVEKPSPNTGVSTTHSTRLNAVDPQNFDWLAIQNGGSFDPQLFGDYRDSQENVLASSIDTGGFFSDPFDIDFLTPFNAPESVVQQKKDILAEIDAQKMEDAMGPSPKPPGNFSGKLLTCTKIWEKLKQCPKVQSSDFDLDSLCKDLKDKAKCTGSGPIVDEKDFKDIIKKYVQADCAKEALELAQKANKP